MVLSCRGTIHVRRPYLTFPMEHRNMARRPSARILLVAACCLTGGRSEAQARSQPDPGLAIVHATVVDVRTGRLNADQTVLVSGTRIQAVGASARVAVPAGWRRVDATGKYVIPGLIDTHTHLGMQWIRQPADTLAQLGWILASGVTTVRDMFAFGGHERGLVALTTAADSGRILSPRIYVSAVLGSLTGNPGPADSALAWVGTRDRLTAFRKMTALGISGAKVLNHTPDSGLAVIRDARNAGVPVYGHTLGALGPGGRVVNYTLDAVNAGIEGVSHVPAALFPLRQDTAGAPSQPRSTPEGSLAWQLFNQTAWQRVSENDLQQLIDTMVARRVWFEPTLLLTSLPFIRFDTLLLSRYHTWERNSRPASDSAVAAAQLGHLEAGRRFIRRFYEAGGIIIAGTDEMPFPPLGVTEEMYQLVNGAGLPPLAALQAATINAARALHWDGTIGTVEPAKRADLVLIDANPLVDIRNVRAVSAVVANGRYLDRAALDSLLARSGTPIAKPAPRD